MSDTETPTLADVQKAALERLEAFQLRRYRAARWRAIDHARRLDLKWEDIAEALDISRPGAIRMYANDKPED